MAIVGIDAGGSKTRLVMRRADVAGEAIERNAGPGNWKTSTPSQWQKQFADLLEGISGVQSVVICAAGIVNRADREVAISLLEPILPGAWIRVVPDYIAPLALEPEGTTVVLSGTGSAVARYDSAGVRKIGGNGYLLGDDGSLFQIGQMFAKMQLHRRQAGTASRDDCHQWDLVTEGKSADEFISWTYDSQIGHQVKLALLGKRYLELTPDLANDSIVRLALENLAKIVMDFEEAREVALGGGLWRVRSELSVIFERILRERGAEDANCRIQTDEPVSGAVKLARLLFDEHGSPQSPLLQP